MQPRNLSLCAAAAAALGLAAGAAALNEEPAMKNEAVKPIALSMPLDYQVFQRRTPRQGAVRVRGEAPEGSEAVEARLTGGAAAAPLDGQWHRLAFNPQTRAIDAALAAPAGGWYRLEVRATRAGRPLAEQAVDHVAVGEVFVVAGQSNAANFGAERQRTDTGRVSCFDGSRWRLAEDPHNGADGGGGSFLPAFGDALFRKCGVPVGVAGVAAGGTSVREWLPEGERMRQQPTTGANVVAVGPGEWACNGALFNRLLSRLNLFGPGGVRAVLWNQGESDAGQARWGYPAERQISGEQYTRFLETVIRASRRQAGWDVPWIVGLATIHSPTEAPDEEFRAAQRALWQSGLAAEGPDSDALKGDNRTDVHFSGPGLRAHGKAWAEKAWPLVGGSDPDLRWLDESNVTWDTPSRDSLGSMPLGNGDIGLNVWVEQDGDLLFYISKTDAFDGNHVNRKLGRVRVALTPNPFAAGRPFRQTLELSSARIAIEAGPVSLAIWVDAHHPVIRVRARSDQAFAARVSLEPIRPHRQAETLAAAFAQPGPPDVLLTDKADRLLWCFRNESSSWPAHLSAEGLGELAKTARDPLLHRTCGALARGPGLARSAAAALAAPAETRALDLSIHILNEQADAPGEWQARLEEQAATVDALDPDEAWAAHCRWWGDFWRRSRIVVRGCEQAQTLTRGYALERFLQACAGRGGFPLIFNGSIFTMDMPAGTYAFCGPRGGAVGADHRDWEGLPIMWQNTRLPYWSMLARGDFDLMQPVFRAVVDALEVAQARAQAWYKHGGAVMTEAMYWKGPSALNPVPQHLQYHFTGSLEMPSMMCDYYAHTQDRQFLGDVLLPCADAFVAFFEQHYPRRDERGRMIIAPAGAVETYQPVTNPVTEVCGLRYLLGRLLELSGEERVGREREARWRRLLQELPPVPTRVVKGQTLLAPGEQYSGRLICETPELYAVYPFRQVSLWSPDLLAVGRQSFAVRQLSLDGTPDVQSWQTGGWVQSPVQAAYLGLPRSAASLVSLNFADQFPCFGNNRFGVNGNTPPPQPDRPRARFPAFWETKMDYTPDCDHGANSANGLQSMVLQADGRQIFLLPAWPEDWEVEFKLHAPQRTTVEGVYRDGRVQALKVTPESRAADVVDMTTLARRVRTLVSIACADRNDLFGLPPMPDGHVSPEDAARLKTTGPWLAKYGESLDGVRGGPFAPGPWGGSVTRGNVIYLHVLEWPAGGLKLPALPKKVVAAAALTGGHVTVKEEGAELSIALAGAERNAVDTIIKLELEAPP